jgi:hypothetical protein
MISGCGNLNPRRFILRHTAVPRAHLSNPRLTMKKIAILTALAFTFAAQAALAETLTGWVADAMCAKDPHKVSSADHAACAKKCISDGSAPVLVVGEKTVYTITNPDILIPHAGEKVTVDGDVNGTALTVKSVKKL